jgi:hypothetical protein
VHEIQLVSKSGNDCRVFVGEAEAMPLLVHAEAEDAGLQLLNLSILEANKKRIMHAEDQAASMLC